MFTVRISAKKLNDLRMMADWQLRELGFDPASVTAACEAASNPRHDYSANWSPVPVAELAEESTPTHFVDITTANKE